MTNIEELKDAIREIHGATATHRESVPVTEKWQGDTVWDGIVEVFDLRGHPDTNTVYAWSRETGDGVKSHVAVLHVPPVVSPITAVRAAIIQEYRNAQTT
jgi:hypothetical protein